ERLSRGSAIWFCCHLRLGGFLRARGEAEEARQQSKDLETTLDSASMAPLHGSLPCVTIDSRGEGLTGHKVRHLISVKGHAALLGDLLLNFAD
ncbi:MAG: hypothetical protein ACO3TX_14165, partial [Pseudomonadales bacterium]